MKQSTAIALGISGIVIGWLLVHYVFFLDASYGTIDWDPHRLNAYNALRVGPGHTRIPREKLHYRSYSPTNSAWFIGPWNTGVAYGDVGNVPGTNMVHNIVMSNSGDWFSDQLHEVQRVWDRWHFK